MFAIIRVFNQQRKLTAVLENAYGISYEKRLNELWLASFSLPLDDPKLTYCQPFHYVEITDDLTNEYIGLYRIEPSLIRKSESTNTVEFTLKHVLATLLDDVLFGYHQTTNWTTKQNIEYILDKQSVKNWRLMTCDFERFFHYKYENENGLLGPLLAIPQPFDEDYRWVYNTQVYPWTISLVRPSTQVTCEIRYAKNMREIEREDDPSNIVNRIYPLGYGEGTNQLSIKDVNNGVPYLEDAASIAKYGLKSYVWVDRRFEDANSLKNNALSLLRQWKDPKVLYKVKAVDLSSITGSSIDEFKEGALVRIIDPDFGTITQRIFMESKPDVTGAPGDIDLEIGSLTDDIATVNADIERKQQVNDAYTQGATNIDSYSYSDNCDSTHPAKIKFFLPSDLVNVNTMTLTYETEEFRSYERATKGGGAITKSTEAGGALIESTKSGGGSTQTSSAGGGSTQTSSSGGGGTQTSSAGGGSVQSTNSAGLHRHRMFSFQVDTESTTAPDSFKNYIAASASDGGSSTGIFAPSGSNNDLYTEEAAGSHSHNVSIPNHTHNVTFPTHTHDVTIPNHTHQVNIPAHTHEVDIPPHTHEIVLPDHTHEIDYGIYELDTLPSAVTIKVDGNPVPITSTSGNEINIIPYLSKDSSGKINRGQWHEVTITPNGLGRITANIITRLFISSHLGGTY